MAASHEEARGADHDYDTTQVFIMPAGDWTRSLSEELKGGVRRHPHGRREDRPTKRPRRPRHARLDAHHAAR